MKNYHALGILIASTIVFVATCSLAIGSERPTSCPIPDQYNSGMVITDEDNDGIPDTGWYIYVDGKCAGFTVNKNDNGIPL